MALVQQSFNFENVELKFFSFVHPTTNEVWIEGNGVAKSLGYKDWNGAIYKIIKNSTFKCKWSDLVQGIAKTPVPSNWQKNTTMINEGGVFALIMASKLPNAQKLHDWVCGTVLPSIRKTGKYELGQDNSVVPLKQQVLQLQNEKQQLQIQLLEKEKEWSDKEHAYQMKIKDLTVQANMTLTEFGVHGLLAQKNMEQNDQMRKQLNNVKNRIVPVVPDRPDIDTFVVCYTNPKNNLIDVRRTQRREVEIRDQIMKEYEENPSKKFKSNRQEQRYGWLRGVEKIIDVPCANAVALWNKIKQSYPDFVYGLIFLNSARTKIRFLNEEEIRKKYREDVEAMNKKEYKNMTFGFEKLQFLDEEDAVKRCLTSTRETKEKMKEIINKAVEDLNKEIEINDEEYGKNTQFSPQDIFDFVTNHNWNLQTNIVNIHNYNKFKYCKEK